MPFWHRIVIAAGVFALVWILARVVDWWLKRRGPLAPEAQTRYFVLRRAVTVTILVVGFLSALLVIPQVRAVAGGLLASSAVIGIVLGLASQQVLSNFMAGLVIASTQPVRIGDRVTYANEEGTIEEIGLTYTFIRTLDRRRLVVPNSKLASDTIINSSIRSRETVAEVRVPLPLQFDVSAAIETLRGEVASERESDVYVDSIDSTANVIVCAVADDELSADRLERDLRLRVHRRLRELRHMGRLDRVESLLTFAEAQSRILAATAPLPAEQVDVAAASGRVLADDVRSVVDLPPFPSSAMDGYAVRAADLPGTLGIVGESAAGAPFAGTLGPGDAVAISTGAVVPEGADAVAAVEIVVRQDNTVAIDRALEPGASVRPLGGDVRTGDVVASAGTRLAPAALAGIAAVGVASVSCARRPRVAILATGSELVTPGEPLELGQIYESNTLMLAAALAVAGAEIVTAPAVPDDEASLRAALERGLECDVLVTSGGVSVGEHDLVREVERELGVEEVFWRVAIKPGKPLAFGTRGATLVFGLPGNPVSALVSAELFVKPALRALQGVPTPLPRFEPGQLGSDLRRNEERDEFVRARVRFDENAAVLEPLRGQESHMIASASAADALVHIPRGNGELTTGAGVSWLRLNSP